MGLILAHSNRRVTGYFATESGVPSVLLLSTTMTS